VQQQVQAVQELEQVQAEAELEQVQAELVQAGCRRSWCRLLRNFTIKQFRTHRFSARFTALARSRRGISLQLYGRRRPEQPWHALAPIIN
jgi:hypothetical protein